MDLERAHAVLGILGNIGSCAFFLSSAPAVIETLKKKSPQDMGSNLYVVTLLNCMLWIFYGLPIIDPHNFWVIVTNSLGVLFALSYITAFFIIVSRDERVILSCKVAIILLDFSGFVLVIIFFIHSQHTRMMIVGTLCAVISSSMHMTLLGQMKAVFDTKERTYLYMLSSIAGFWKGIAWTAYGAVSLRWFIVIPNSVGIAVGMVQVALVLKARAESALTTNADPNSAGSAVSIFVPDDQNQEKEKESQSIEHFVEIDLKEGSFPCYKEAMR